MQEIISKLNQFSDDELVNLMYAIKDELARRQQQRPLVRVMFPASILGDRRKALSGTYVKRVTSVDRTKTNGFAFDGEFIKTDRETDLPQGSIIVIASGTGSWKHPNTTYYVLKVKQGSEWECEDWRVTVTNVEFMAAFEQSQFLSLRDFVADLVEKRSDA